MELNFHGLDWLTLNMSVPSAGHIGGVLEREIRLVYFL